eukprot:403369152
MKAPKNQTNQNNMNYSSQNSNSINNSSLQLGANYVQNVQILHKGQSPSNSQANLLRNNKMFNTQMDASLHNKLQKSRAEGVQFMRTNDSQEQLTKPTQSYKYIGILKPLPKDQNKEHVFWLQRVRREGNGKLRSISRGLDMGIMRDIPAFDCQNLQLQTSDQETNEDYQGSPQKVLPTTLSRGNLLINLKQKLTNQSNSQARLNLQQTESSTNAIANHPNQNRQINRIQIQTINPEAKVFNQSEQQVSQKQINPPFGLFPNYNSHSYQNLNSSLPQNTQSNDLNNSSIRVAAGVEASKQILIPKKKCYAQNQEMNWVQSKIDLSFPDLSKKILVTNDNLDDSQSSMKHFSGNIFPHNLMRKESQILALAKNTNKIQNRRMSSYGLNDIIAQRGDIKSRAKEYRDKYGTSQINLAYFSIRENPVNSGVGLKSNTINQSPNHQILMQKFTTKQGSIDHNQSQQSLKYTQVQQKSLNDKLTINLAQNTNDQLQKQQLRYSSVPKQRDDLNLSQNEDAIQSSMSINYMKNRQIYQGQNKKHLKNQAFINSQIIRTRNIDQVKTINLSQNISQNLYLNKPETPFKSLKDSLRRNQLPPSIKIQQ